MWPKIQKKSPEETTVQEKISEDRIVHYGLFGLFTKTEKHQRTIQKKVITDYWILDYRNWHLESVARGSHTKQERHTRYKYCLRTNGELFIRTEYEDGEIIDGKWHFTHDNSEKKMDDNDVKLLDFEPEIQSQYGINYKNDIVNIDTNRAASIKKLVKIKGEGLITRLEKLLN